MEDQIHTPPSKKSAGLGVLFIGLTSLASYYAAFRIGNLLAHIPSFEVAFVAAFALCTLAAVMVLRMRTLSRGMLVWIFAVAIVSQVFLLFYRPVLSDDMYRYVWDGRVQARGISPYRYAPNAPQLAALREDAIWKLMNRKAIVTVYPPGAEIVFAVLWRIWPDNVRWFQITMAAASLLAGAMLLGLLKDLGLSPGRVSIYLWSPLVAYETAHSAHVDALVLPVLVGAWWARAREHDGWTGVLLGLATAIKLYPALLFPALWRPQDRQGRWRMPLAFLLTLAGCYLPYVLQSGWGVLGYLPQYFNEQFNLSPVLAFLLPRITLPGPAHGKELLLLTLGILAMLSIWMILRPAPDHRTALGRGIWMMGTVALLTQNSYSWYLLWMLPLLAIFLQPGQKPFPFLRLDGWTAWWAFTGLVGLSYTFFIRWKPDPPALWVEYLPLYLLLFIALVQKARPTLVRLIPSPIARKLPKPNPEGEQIQDEAVR